MFGSGCRNLVRGDRLAPGQWLFQPVLGAAALGVKMVEGAIAPAGRLSTL